MTDKAEKLTDSREGRISLKKRFELEEEEFESLISKKTITGQVFKEATEKKEEVEATGKA